MVLAMIQYYWSAHPCPCLKGDQMPTSNAINHWGRPPSPLASTTTPRHGPDGATTPSSWIRSLPTIVAHPTSDLTREVGTLYEWFGHGVAQICRKANDSYRGESR
jgi:hypothetical protein